jgi:hypothetical protein
MKSPLVAALVGAAVLVLATGGASADIVCNDEGECWHVKERYEYKPELKLHVYPDDWKWGEKEHYKWREHEGHGYWRGGVWIDL